MSSPWVPRGEALSHDLTSRTAAMARGIAAVLRELDPKRSLATISWLEEWAERVTVRAVPLAPAPLDRLVGRLGLTPVEVDLVLLAGLPEEHERIAGAFRRLHPRKEPHPTVTLARELTPRDNPDLAMLRRVLLEGVATRVGVLALTGDAPFVDRSLTLAPGLWDALHGHDGRPPGLDRVDVGDPPAGLAGWLGLPAVARALAAWNADAPVTLVLAASDASVGLSRAAALARAANARLVGARVHTADDVRLLVLHAATRSAVPLLMLPASEPVPAAEPGGHPILAPTGFDLAGIRGPVLVCGPPGSFVAGADRPAVPVPLGPIGAADRRAAWRSALPAASHLAPELAARHPLDPALTAQVALDLEIRDGAEPPTRAEVSAAIRARAGATLPPGVELRTPGLGSPRPILATDAGAQLRDAVRRLSLQATVLDDWGLDGSAGADRGVRLLFTGPPGTGKTLAAAALAADAGTDLLVVDVSRVVSKWLGETEKNLAAAFETAERTQAVLLLDEADVLFATRTEVGDAQDRYANLETAYLLQRLDHFDGLAVLATNLRQNMDAAFLRRMDHVVEFERPDAATRRVLWVQHLPVGRVDADVDLDRLARRFDVTGGTIRNAAIAAAFLAAEDGPEGPVRETHLLLALRREYAKDHRPFPEIPDPAERPRDAAAAELLAEHSREVGAAGAARSVVAANTQEER